MSFTFDARTLLELGKELISTDEVAIFELVKNAVDANSPNISIEAKIRLRYSDFQTALDRLEDGDETADVLEFIREKWIVSNTKPVLEAERKLKAALSDSGVFESTLRKTYKNLNTLTFEDSGDGMSLDTLRNVFMRIGTRSRRNENNSGSKKLGDKGIGRLSAMRLGERLSIRTATINDTHWNRLKVDWTWFDTDSPKSVEDIDVDPFRGDPKENKTDKGTKIIISDLTGDWDFVRFSDIFTGRISRIIDPFESGLANRIIKARHNKQRVLIPSVPKQLIESAHARMNAELKFVPDDEGKLFPEIHGQIHYPLQTKAVQVLDFSSSSVVSLASTPVKRRAKKGHAAMKIDPVSIKTLKKLGGFSFEVYWWNRRVVEAIDGLTSTTQQSRNAIAEWSGGPMLYRHDYRILPYGDPGDDWLALDSRALSSSGFKMNRSQIIGRIRLDTPHIHLSEQTNREGLIESPVFKALREIMKSLLHVHFRSFIDNADDVAKEKQSSKAAETYNDIKGSQQRVQKILHSIETKVDPSLTPEVSNLSGEINRLSSKSSSLLSRFDRIIRENEAERRKLVYLAGIGLLTEFVFHELERAVSHAILMIDDGHENPMEVLRPQLETLYKRISAFDDMTAERRQSKSTFDIAKQVSTLISHHRSEFDRHSIDWEIIGDDDIWEIKAVRGMVIQIIENLIVNAAYWLKQEASIKRGFKPRIKILIDAKAKTITIEDNGPGISPEQKDEIFKPFVTDKPAGTGRGLGLYISRELAEYHKWSLVLDDEPTTGGGKRLSRFVLSTGG